MPAGSFVSVIDSDQKGRHIAIEHAMTTGPIGLVFQMPCDVREPMSFLAPGCIDQARGRLVAISPEGLEDPVLPIVLILSLSRCR